MVMQETVTVMLSAGHGDKPEPVEIPRRVANVKVGEMLGEGTGGVVFTGFDDVLGRRVAVKFLHRRRGTLNPAALTELANGIRAAARVKHPNIVTVHSVETQAGMPVIVMEFVDGVSMRDLIVRGGALDYPLAVFVMRSIVSAVAALHEANIVHRDLKPANILFDREGQAHVVDFGLACDFDVTHFRGAACNIGGSPLYMAPEMYEGHVSPQSDVYALGVILFEVLAGAAPFTADTIEAMRAQHERGDVPLHVLSRRGVPDDAVDLVSRALHRQRFLRFKTAAHLSRALEELPIPEKREETLRMRLASAVGAARASRTAPAAPQPANAVSDSPSMTTFDLVAQRARQKRLGRE